MHCAQWPRLETEILVETRTQRLTGVHPFQLEWNMLPSRVLHEDASNLQGGVSGHPKLRFD
jgi:hypothetical protein